MIHCSSTMSFPAFFFPLPGGGLSSSSVKNTESPCRASMIVGMSERAGGEKEAPFRKKKKNKAGNDIAEERWFFPKIWFLFMLAEAKTAAYGLQEQKKKSDRYIYFAVAAAGGAQQQKRMSWYFLITIGRYRVTLRLSTLLKKGHQTTRNIQSLKISLDYTMLHLNER